MTKRTIVHIDESKCDGCGLCVPSCAEGAIRIIDGKARLVSDVYCDGLGACLGHCPRGAISMIEREAEPFDESAVEQARAVAEPLPVLDGQNGLPVVPRGTCPSASATVLPPQDGPQPSAASPRPHDPNRGAPPEDGPPSSLANWPVQLRLVPPRAPFLQGADLLLAADCVPFAFADFHRRFLDGRPVLIGCPKLDDGRSYVEKLTGIIASCGIRKLTVIHMEVPCCTGLLRIAEAAVRSSGADVPVESVTISLRGEVLAAGD